MIIMTSFVKNNLMFSVCSRQAFIISNMLSIIITTIRQWKSPHPFACHVWILSDTISRCLPLRYKILLLHRDLPLAYELVERSCKWSPMNSNIPWQTNAWKKWGVKIKRLGPSKLLFPCRNLEDFRSFEDSRKIHKQCTAETMESLCFKQNFTFCPRPSAHDSRSRVTICC